MPSPEVESAFERLVRAMAGPDALPAGGAAGITAIAMGVALGAKVIRSSPGAPAQLGETEARLGALLERILPEFNQDCVAFERVLAAWRRPRDEATREAAIRTAWHAATDAPVAVATLAAQAESLLASCTGQVNPNLAGDLSAALELVRAGRRIAASNARENARHLDPGTARQLLDRLPPDSGR